nr:hypothetical protein BaRGS_023572 [Batillaria attramentaria]
MLQRTFNSWLREQGVKECYHSIMAGGDKALFTSQEAVEDDPVLGARLLQEAAEGKSHVLFFGITCGLSAPFVADYLRSYKLVWEKVYQEKTSIAALLQLAGNRYGLDDVRGFLEGGFSTLGNSDGDLSHLCPVISGTGLWKWAALLYSELAVKWTLNAVSTGAHILKGKVFNNTMIDLKPSNVKLFHRAVGIIQRYSNLPVEQCRDYLLRALYSTDTLTEDIQNSPLAQHIKIGASKLRVVPTALLAALLKRPIAEAEKILQQQPITRQAVLASLNQQ